MLQVYDYMIHFYDNLTLINIKGTAYAEGNHASPAFTINVFQSLSTNVDALRLREDNVEVVSGMFLLTLNPRTKIPPVPSGLCEIILFSCLFNCPSKNWK